MTTRLATLLNYKYGVNFTTFLEQIEEPLQINLQALNYKSDYNYILQRADEYNLSTAGSNVEVQARIIGFLTSMASKVTINTSLEMLSQMHKTRNIKYRSGTAVGIYDLTTKQKIISYNLLLNIVPLGVNVKINYKSYLHINNKYLLLNNKYITLTKSTE